MNESPDIKTDEGTDLIDHLLNHIKELESELDDARNDRDEFQSKLIQAGNLTYDLWLLLK